MLESKLWNCQTDPLCDFESKALWCFRPDILEAGHLPCSAAETLPAQNLSYSNNAVPFELVTIVLHHSDSIWCIPFKWKTIQKTSPNCTSRAPFFWLEGHWHTNTSTSQPLESMHLQGFAWFHPLRSAPGLLSQHSCYLQLAMIGRQLHIWTRNTVKKAPVPRTRNITSVLRWKMDMSQSPMTNLRAKADLFFLLVPVPCEPYIL